MTIGISELQKNISIFKNLTETVHVIDKKTKEVLALILPKPQIEKTSLTDALGGILQSKKSITPNHSINQIVADAYTQEMEEKYGK